MTSFILRRLLSAVPALLGITLLSFVVVHLSPGTPVGAGGMDPKMSAQARERLTTLYGLDRPVLERYAAWVARLVRADLGRSFTDGEPVAKKIAAAAPITLAVNLTALLLALFGGIWLGVYGALRRGSAADRSISAATLALYSMPGFWLSLIFIGLFGVHWRLLPVSGLYSVLHEDMGFFGRFFDIASHLAMPVMVLTLISLAGISRFVRAGMVHELEQTYVRAARARGLSEARVVYGHALRNALLPVITVIGLSIPGLLGGSVVIESIFSVPGMGRLFYNAVFSRDYPLIMGVLVLGAVLTLLGNLAADIAYRAADPRIRSGR